MAWTSVKSYSITRRALEAWVQWRFAAALATGAKVAVENKDGDYIVHAPHKLSSSDKQALQKALKDKEHWEPPDETWEQLNGVY